MMQLGQPPRSEGAGFSPAKGNPQCCSAKKSDFRKRETLMKGQFDMAVCDEKRYDVVQFEEIMNT